MSKEATLKKWEQRKRPRRSRVVIYDFDNTIFNSPNREQGEAAYMEATGQKFPFDGWYGRVESMQPPIVPEKPGPEWLVEATIAAYREDAKDQNSEKILMTGRPFKWRWRIIEICDLHDLKFDEHFFRGQPNSRGRDTLEIKANFIEEHLIHPALKTLEIWEDRPEHVSEFFNLSKRWKSKYRNHLERIVIHNVLSGENHEI